MHFKISIDNSVNKIKTIWRVIKKETNKGNTDTTQPQLGKLKTVECTNKFNDHFLTIAEKIGDNTSKSVETDLQLLKENYPV